RMAEWNRFGELVYVENMDIRKPIGQTAADLASIFAELPRACLCFDIGHARQVDPTMSEAAQILLQFKARLRQLHISDVNAQSKHDPLSLEAVMAFRRVASLIPAEDRKSTRLNSSHLVISYAVFCLKKKNLRLDKSALPGLEYIINLNQPLLIAASSQFLGMHLEHALEHFVSHFGSFLPVVVVQLNS